MKGKLMAELKCKDGTVIKISDETEAELRKAFGPKPNYKDAALRVYVNEGVTWPITIEVARSDENHVTRDVKNTETFIVALQEAVEYCKRNNLGD